MRQLISILFLVPVLTFGQFDLRKSVDSVDNELDGFEVFAYKNKKIGIYDLNLNEFSIPPIYTNHWRFNQFLFLLKSNINHEKEETFYFDVFERINGGWVKFQENLTAAYQLNFSHYLNVDSMDFVSAQCPIVTYKNGKVGLVRLEINAYGRFKYAVFEQVLQNEFDFIKLIEGDFGDDFYFLSCNQGHIPSIGFGTYSAFIEHSELRFLHHGWHFIKLTTSIKAWESSASRDNSIAIDSVKTHLASGFSQRSDIDYNPKPKSDSYWADYEEYPNIQNFGLTIWNDSLLYFENNKIDFYNKYSKGEELGFEKSGVFNLNSKKWLILPKYRSCIITDKGIDVVNIIRAEIRAPIKIDTITMILF